MLLEYKLFDQFALFVLIGTFLPVILCEEIIHQVEFLTQSAFDQSRAIIKEFLEIFSRNDRLLLFSGHLLTFCLRKLLLGLTLGTNLSDFTF